MNKFLKTSATGLILAAGLNAGQTTAEVRFDNTTISQATCEARLFHSKRPIHKTYRLTNRLDSSLDSSKVAHKSRELSVEDWPTRALDLLSTLQDSDFEEGTLSIVDCVGSSNTARVRTQRFELENFNRQGNERRGWRFNAEAQNLDEPILRLVRLELPPSYLWKTNAKGNALIAERTLVHARGNDDFERFPRIRTTEVKHLNGALLVTQRTTTNDLFDELVTWTLK